jgi:hypothetical protein
VQSLAVASAVACFVPQGAGVKMLSWNSGNSKLLNPNKYVRSMALVHGKLFCGCNDGSIQVCAAPKSWNLDKHGPNGQEALTVVDGGWRGIGRRSIWRVARWA